MKKVLLLCSTPLLLTFISSTTFAKLYDETEEGRTIQIDASKIQCNDEMGNAFVHTSEEEEGLRVIVTIPKTACAGVLKTIKDSKSLDIRLEHVGKAKASNCASSNKKFQDIRASAQINGISYNFKTISADAGYTTDCSAP